MGVMVRSVMGDSEVNIVSGRRVCHCQGHIYIYTYVLSLIVFVDLDTLIMMGVLFLRHMPFGDPSRIFIYICIY
jgi:hypothetical protein